MLLLLLLIHVSAHIGYRAPGSIFGCSGIAAPVVVIIEPAMVVDAKVVVLVLVLALVLVLLLLLSIPLVALLLPLLLLLLLPALLPLKRVSAF